MRVVGRVWTRRAAAAAAGRGSARSHRARGDAPGARRRHLVEILGFSSTPTPKEAVLLEYFLNNLRFAASCKFTTEKTSALFSILRANHEEMVRGFMRLDQSLLYFKELLLLHAVQRPPYSIGIFTFKDVVLITDYVNSTCARRRAAGEAGRALTIGHAPPRGAVRAGRCRRYYKHFKLFQYCFTQSHELVLVTRSNLCLLYTSPSPRD